ncbi:MAG TPA: vWA domain-containing protein [Chloroflexia bacterium]|jgi:hypothetical protein
MNYTNKATARTPAHVIFLIDISGSMNQMSYGQSRIGVVSQALTEVIFQMVDMSTKVVGTQPEIRPRFKVAILGYNEQPWNTHGGFVPIDKLAEIGTPIFRPEGETNTFLGFQTVEQLLDSIIPTLGPEHPAPLVCHLSDGEYNQGNSPLALVDRIRARVTPDGPVLVENIFVNDSSLRVPFKSIQTWQGVTSENDLVGEYAKELFRMSSPIPVSYLETTRYWGFSNIQPGARLMFPGSNPELIKTALVTTGSSGGMPRQRPKE